MKIVEVTEYHIKFDNGNAITYDHEQDCCEYNFADFEQLDDLARSYNFKEEIAFEYVADSGFWFGDDLRKFFVPCYSDQNGYYSTEISIYYNGNPVLSFCAEMRES